MTRVRELAVGLARRLVRLVLALVAVRVAVGVVGELVVSAVLGPAVVVLVMVSQSIWGRTECTSVATRAIA